MAFSPISTCRREQADALLERSESDNCGSGRRNALGFNIMRVFLYCRRLGVADSESSQKAIGQPGFARSGRSCNRGGGPDGAIAHNFAS